MKTLGKLHIALCAILFTVAISAFAADPIVDVLKEVQSKLRLRLAEVQNTCPECQIQTQGAEAAKNESLRSYYSAVQKNELIVQLKKDQDDTKNKIDALLAKNGDKPDPVSQGVSLGRAVEDQNLSLSEKAQAYLEDLPSSYLNDKYWHFVGMPFEDQIRLAKANADKNKTEAAKCDVVKGDGPNGALAYYCDTACSKGEYTKCLAGIKIKFKEAGGCAATTDASANQGKRALQGLICVKTKDSKKLQKPEEKVNPLDFVVPAT